MKAASLAMLTFGMAAVAVVAGAALASRHAAEPAPSTPPASRPVREARVPAAPAPSAAPVIDDRPGLAAGTATSPAAPVTPRPSAGATGRSAPATVAPGPVRSELEPMPSRAGNAAGHAGPDAAPPASTPVGGPGPVPNQRPAGTSGNTAAGNAGLAGTAASLVVGSPATPDPNPKPTGGKTATTDTPDKDPNPNHGVVRVRLVAGAAAAVPGQRVAVHVVLENASDVTSVPFHVGFDPAVLRFESGEQGAFLGSDGHQSIVMAAVMSSGNAVVVGASRLGAGPGINGTGEIAVLNFRVVGPGTSPLAFTDASVWNSQNQPIAAQFESSSITLR